MEQWNYENTNMSNFLVYQVFPEEQVDTVALGMLTNNVIDGFLPMIFLQNNEKRFFKYDITSKISLKMYFDGAVNKKRFLEIILSICNTFEQCEDYMLEPASIVLNSECIFVDVGSSKAYLACKPILTEDKTVKISEFLKNLVMTIQFDSHENCNYIARFLNVLNSCPNVSVSEIKTMANEMMGDNDISEKKAEAAPKPQQEVVSVNAGNMSDNVNSVNNMNASVLMPETVPAPTVNKNIPNNGAMPIPDSNIPQDNNAKQEKHSKGGFFSKFKKSNKAENSAKTQNPAEPPKSSVPIPGLNVPENAPNMAIPGAPDPIAIPGASAAPIAIPGNANNKNGSQNNVHSKLGQGGIFKKKKEPKNNDKVQQNIMDQQPMPMQQFENCDVSVQQNVAAPISQQTTVLSRDMLVGNGNPKLYRFKTNELIEINKTPFKIGREEGFVDYCVSDNLAVGRSHANIVKHDDDYFIIDTNSTNHTFINGNMIPSNIEHKLEENTKVRLANEEFEFRFF